VDGILDAIREGLSVNRPWYVLLWMGEILAIVGLVLALTLPVQDNALKEYIAWQQHPSAETYKVFLEKKRQDRAVGFIVAIPFAIMVALLSGPLRRYSERSRRGARSRKR
jgi:hypothetical protein